MLDFDGWVMLDPDDYLAEAADWPDDELHTYEAVLELAQCPYCACLLDRATGSAFSPHFHDPRAGWDSGGACYLTLAACGYCGFWQAQTWLAPNSHTDRIRERVYAARARNFDEIGAGAEGLVCELAQVLRREPSSWSDFSAVQFERFVGSILRAFDASAEVVHVGRSGDGGRDLLIFHSDGSIVPVQVKRRLTVKAEPVETVRSLMGVLYDEGFLRGVVVTTADRFTRGAVQAAARHAGSIRLLDKGKLNLMLSPLIPDRPWSTFSACIDRRTPVGAIVQTALGQAEHAIRGLRVARGPVAVPSGYSWKYQHPALYGPPPWER